MTKEITYIANDGTKFEDYNKCLDYENKDKYLEFKDTALLFDRNGNQMPLCANVFRYQTCYIKALTDEAAQFMAKTFKEYNNPWTITSWSDWDNYNPIKAGVWVRYEGKWISATELQSWLNILS